MSDIVERLRSPEKVVIPAGTEMTFIHSTSQWPHTLFPVMVCGGTGGTMRNLEPFSVAISSSDRLEAAVEIERLRARVAVLETALRHYADDDYNGYNGNGDCARAALEAKS
jgi:hypothetical protein